MSTARASLGLSVIVLFAVFAAPAIAAIGGSLAFQANLAKIDPAVLAPASTPAASTPSAPASAPTPTLTAAIVKLRNLASPAWAAGGHDSVVRSLQDVAARSQAPLVQLVESRGGRVLSSLWLSNTLLVSADAATFRLLAQNPSVERIVPNGAVTLPPETTSSAGPQQGPYEWNIAKVRAPEAWSLGITGTGVRVCVSDTGFDVNHPDVGPRLFTLNPADPAYPGGWMEFDVNGNPVYSTPHDTYGHGTHVSGTIAGGTLSGAAIGVAPGVSLMEALILPGGGGTDQEVLAGMQWCVQPTDASGHATGYPAHVMSMSWGNSAGLATIMLDAVRNALLAGIIPVAAIGNCGEGCAGSPGDIWGVFGTGATDINDQVAYFSSGKVVNWPSPPTDWPFFGTYPASYIKPDFSAPGVDVLSTYPGGGYLVASGTSMATPHLSATVALMVEASGFSLTPEQAYRNLVKSSIDLGAPGQDDRYGYGRIDTFEAVLLSLIKNTGVQGTVYDHQAGTPLANATVHVDPIGFSIRTAANGTFRLGLPEGDYTLTFDKFGYYSQSIPIHLVVYNGTLEGTVSDSHGAPIVGAQVDVIQANVSATTDASGFYQLSVKAGSYDLVASANLKLPATASVEVGENATTVANFTLLPDIPTVITGTVTQSGTGAPLAGALVWARGPDSFQATTDASGAYTLNISQQFSGTYTVGAFKGGYWGARSTVVASPGAHPILDFTVAASSPSAVAVYEDWSGELKALLGSAGYTVTEFQNPDAVDLLWNLSAFSVVYWSGFGGEANASSPDKQTFTDILTLGDTIGVSFVFADSYSNWPYGIRLLSTYLGDPATRGYAYGEGNVSYQILVDHPIFQGVGHVGDDVRIIQPQGPEDGDYTWFSGFSGTVLATTGSQDGGRKDAGAGVLDRPGGTEWVLLGSLAPQTWTHVSNDWTSAAIKIAQNAVAFGAGHSWAAGLGSAGRVVLRTAAVRAAPASAGYLPLAWTNLTVYLDPKPTGVLKGYAMDLGENPLVGAAVTAVATPVSNLTDAYGLYTLPLPIGLYTIQASLFGYRTTTVNVTVLEGQTVYANFSLGPLKKVGIMYDSATLTLRRALEASGEFAVLSFAGEWDELIAETPHLDLLVLSGIPGASVVPSGIQFNALLAAADAAHTGILFLDNVYGYGGPFGYNTPYGISLLVQYRGDPAYRAEPFSCSGTPYQEVTAAHGVTRGYAVGDMPALATTTCMPFSYFGGFSGTTIGRIWTGYGGSPSYLYGDNLAYEVTAGGSRWVLLAGYAPVFGYDSFWTNATRDFLVNAALWATGPSFPVVLTPSSGIIGTTVSFSGSAAPANTDLNLTFAGTFLGVVATDGAGSFAGSFVVPESSYGNRTVSLIAPDLETEGDAAFLVQASLSIAPAEGPPGTDIVVEGHGFGSTTSVSVHFPGLGPTYVSTSPGGAFRMDFLVPFVAEGTYNVTVTDNRTGAVASAMFHVSETIPLEIQASVGVLHFRGEVVTVYMLVTSLGDATDAVVSATLYPPSGATLTLSASHVTTGLYKATYSLPGNAPTGTYALVASASVPDTFRHAAALSTFLVSPTLTTQNAAIVALQGDLAQVRTDVGTILVNLTAVDAKVTAIQGDTATLTTSIGTMQASLADLGATLESVQGGVAHLHTHLGEQSVALSNLQTTGGNVAMYAAIAAAGFSAAATVLALLSWSRGRRSKEP